MLSSISVLKASHSDRIRLEQAVNVVCDHCLGPFGFLEESHDEVQVNHLPHRIGISFYFQSNRFDLKRPICESPSQTYAIRSTDCVQLYQRGKYPHRM
jgi:hypothetical protein